MDQLTLISILLGILCIETFTMAVNNLYVQRGNHKIFERLVNDLREKLARTKKELRVCSMLLEGKTEFKGFHITPFGGIHNIIGEKKDGKDTKA